MLMIYVHDFKLDRTNEASGAEAGPSFTNAVDMGRREALGQFLGLQPREDCEEASEWCGVPGSELQRGKLPEDARDQAYRSWSRKSLGANQTCVHGAYARFCPRTRRTLLPGLPIMDFPADGMPQLRPLVSQSGNSARTGSGSVLRKVRRRPMLKTKLPFGSHGVS